MKKMGKRAIALLAACVLLCACLTACIGKYKVQGSYTAWVGSTDVKIATLEFKGDKVIYESSLLGTTKEGTYELEDGVVTITYEDGSTSELDFDEDADELSLGGVMIFKKDKQS